MRETMTRLEKMETLTAHNDWAWPHQRRLIASERRRNLELRKFWGVMIR